MANIPTSLIIIIPEGWEGTQITGSVDIQTMATTEEFSTHTAEMFSRIRRFTYKLLLKMLKVWLALTSTLMLANTVADTR